MQQTHKLGGDDAQVVPLFAAEATRRPQALLALVACENLAAVGVAFGAATAHKVRAALQSRAETYIEGSGVAHWVGEHLVILINDPILIRRRLRVETPEVRKIQAELTAALASDPIESEGATVLAAVTLALEPLEPPHGDIDDATLALLTRKLVRQVDAASPRLAAVAPDRYVADMAAAVRVANAIREHSVALAWQPVRGGQDETRILYHEGLLRLIDAEGVPVPAGNLVGVLEALGLVRTLDAHVVGLAIHKLRAEAGLVLGCNISAQSAHLDGWWTPLISVLEREPDLAERLVVEITETTPFVDIDLTRAFVERLRSLGCRIAIDDFGVGHASFRTVQALRPDIIKVDALYLRLALRSDEAGASPLNHLIGLAKWISADVVVEGVENARAQALAVRSGATWVQGYHVGVPAFAVPPSELRGPMAPVRSVESRIVNIPRSGAMQPQASRFGPWLTRSIARLAPLRLVALGACGGVFRALHR